MRAVDESRKTSEGLRLTTESSTAPGANGGNADHATSPCWVIPEFRVGPHYHADDGRRSALLFGVRLDELEEGAESWALAVYDHEAHCWLENSFSTLFTPDDLHRKQHMLQANLEDSGFDPNSAVWTCTDEGPDTYENYLCAYGRSDGSRAIAFCTAWQPELRRIALQEAAGAAVSLLVAAPIHVDRAEDLPTSLGADPLDWPWYPLTDRLEGMAEGLATAQW